LAKRGLGKGIEALIPPTLDAKGEDVLEVDPKEIQPNPYQPRKTFNDEKIEELAASMLEHGVIQPLIVRRVEGGYQLVAGERRLRAALKAGIAKVPAVVRAMGDREAMEISLVENLQREDLGPLEEAEAYQRLVEEFGLTQEELAKRVGKSRSEVANTMRLTKLEPEVKDLLAQGRLSAGHGRALLSLEGREQVKLARAIINRGLTVRKVEEVVSGKQKTKGSRDDTPGVRVKEAEELLGRVLGSPVAVRMHGSRGTISITFFGQEDLERLVEVIQKGADETTR